MKELREHADTNKTDRQDHDGQRDVDRGQVEEKSTPSSTRSSTP
jgi:hypothetical protein